MACCGKVVGAFCWREGVDDPSDGGSEPVDGALAGLAQHGFEPGEGVLDGVEAPLISFGAKEQALGFEV